MTVFNDKGKYLDLDLNTPLQQYGLRDLCLEISFVEGDLGSWMAGS